MTIRGMSALFIKTLSTVLPVDPEEDMTISSHSQAVPAKLRWTSSARKDTTAISHTAVRLARGEGKRVHDVSVGLLSGSERVVV